MRMKRGGFSHIEMVLAFILFIGVVVFVIYFLSLNKNVEDSGNNLTKLRDKILINLSVPVKEYSIRTYDKDALIISLDVAGNTNDNAAVLNSTGQVVQTNYNGISLCFNSQTDGLYRIIFSQDIYPNYTLGIHANKIENYSLGPAINFQMSSEKKARALNTSYYQNYDGLRQSLGINKDFSFLVSINGNIIANASQNIPKEVQVYRTEENKEFLMENGQKAFGKVEIAIW